MSLAVKFALRVATVGVMLHCGAHAAAQGAPVEPSSGNGAKAVVVVQSAPAPGKKSNPVRREEAAPADIKKKAAQQDGAIESPADATQQSVELRGLRG